MTGSFKLLCFLSIFLVCLTSSAQDNTQKAAEHFKKGVALFKGNKKEAAVIEFKTAFRLKPSWKIMYNIGQCEASLRRYGMAIEAFEAYLGEGGDEVSVERRDEVLKELDRLRKMVGSVRVNGPPGYDIIIDDIKRGQTPMSSSVMVTAGVEHRISVIKGNKKILDVAEKVSGGEILELNAEEPGGTPTPVPTPQPATETPQETNTATPVEPAPEPLPPQNVETTAPRQASQPTRPAPAPSRRKIFPPVVFIVSASAAVVFGGATIGLAVAIDKKWQSSEDKIYDDPWAVNSGAISDNLRTLQAVSWATLGLAAAGVVMTAVSLPFTKWGGSESKDSAKWTLTPFSGSSANGLSLQGRF